MKVEKIIKGPGNTKVTDEDVIKTMEKHGFNKAAAARELNVNRITIARRWEKINQ